MATQMRTLKATCICGSGAHDISIRREDFPLKAYMCHCTSCRHMTGALCLTVTFLPPYYKPDQLLLDSLTSFAFTKRITQYFCPTCGCHMLARCLADGDDLNSEVTWDVTTGTLESMDDILEWQGHEHINDTLDGGFSDMLVDVKGKRLQRWPAHFPYDKEPSDISEQELPLYGLAPRQSSSSDTVRGHCKCGGVDFYIARPSPRATLAKKTLPDLSFLEDINESNVHDGIELFWLRDSGTKFLSGVCMCNSCRLASGVETTFWTFIPTLDLSIGEKGELPFTFNFGTLKKYTSSEGCQRYFCHTCGATCFYDVDDRKFIIDVATGLLAAPEGSRAESWLKWRTSHISHHEDCVPRAAGLAAGVQKGLQAWEEHRNGQNGSEDA